MQDPILRLDTPELRERSLDHMILQLQLMASAAAHNTVEHRGNALLAEIMPVFVRALDRERKMLAAEVRAGNTEAVDDFMAVMMLPVVNMIGATLVTLMPCKHQPAPCESCMDVRAGLLRTVLDNLFQGASSYVTCPVDKDACGVDLHA